MLLSDVVVWVLCGQDQYVELGYVWDWGSSLHGPINCVCPGDL